MSHAVIDLHFQGRAHVIATAVVRGPDGLALVDPGPTTCLPALEAGLADLGATLQDVRHVLITHIHLDHAGAAGTIAARVPGARVYVHERGAPHMVNPARLLASATRLYGDQMDVLWGAFEPVPEDRVVVLRGGERLDVAGRPLQVAYTPGHAVHHVSYLDEQSGTAYVGDTCGIRVAGDFVIAATPPPDIDVETWHASLSVIEAWQPAALFLTHFGPTAPARAHLARYRQVLDETAAWVQSTLALDADDEARARRFAGTMMEQARAALGETEAAALALAAPFDQIWAGLARYWRKKAA